MGEVPSKNPLIYVEGGDPTPLTDRTDTEYDHLGEYALIGEFVFFVTRVDAYPGVVVVYNNTTGRVRVQTFNKKTDGTTLSHFIPHISSGEVPCWAWKHETPFGGIQSGQSSGRTRV